MSCPDKNKCRLCGGEGHLAWSCPTPWGNRGANDPTPPLEHPVTDASVAGAVAAEAVNASLNAEMEASPSSETLVDNGSNNAGLNVAQTSPSDGARVEGTPKAPSESSQIDSYEINDFTSQGSQESSSQDSESISQFSDQSQSILRNTNGSEINEIYLSRVSGVFSRLRKFFSIL